MTPDEFISWLAPVAQRICKAHGLYPSMCIAQGAIESGWGESKIGEYNIFGRKAVEGDSAEVVTTQEYYGWAGKMVTIQDYFKLYNSLDEAIEDYCILLKEEPAYAHCLELLGDLESYVRCVAQTYATDPDYGDKIMASILANDLTQYDA